MSYSADIQEGKDKNEGGERKQQNKADMERNRNACVRVS